MIFCYECLRNFELQIKRDMIECKCKCKYEQAVNCHIDVVFCECARIRMIGCTETHRKHNNVDSLINYVNYLCISIRLSDHLIKGCVFVVCCHFVLHIFHFVVICMLRLPLKRSGQSV